MRTIGVADWDRTIDFYRDILGFLVNGNEAVRGPARIEFASEPSGAMLFLETNDLDAMHAEITGRGGQPGPIEKVNWIKFRMFSIADPDGHIVWFGQTYNEPDSETKGGLLEQALPELPFDDVPAAIEHYQSALGFKVNYRQDDLGVMYRDKITILLIQRTEKHKGIGSFEVYVANADALYEELRARGAKVQGPPVSHPWGLRDFQVLDLEGNRITFAQPFE
jgi:uncharacterized glyoxalase superfamily protein PhnB